MNQFKVGDQLRGKISGKIYTVRRLTSARSKGIRIWLDNGDKITERELFSFFDKADSPLEPSSSLLTTVQSETPVAEQPEESVQPQKERQPRFMLGDQVIVRKSSDDNPHGIEIGTQTEIVGIELRENGDIWYVTSADCDAVVLEDNLELGPTSTLILALQKKRLQRELHRIEERLQHCKETKDTVFCAKKYKIIRALKKQGFSINLGGVADDIMRAMNQD